MRKTVCVLAAVLLSVLLAVDVSAGDLTADVLVTLIYEEEPVEGGTVELCRVGEPVAEGYLLGKEFGGGIIAMEDVPSPDFAAWMATRAGLGHIKAVEQEGVVRYSHLEPGLYLVRQRNAAPGFLPFAPYLVVVTGDINLVDTYPELELGNPLTAQSPEPWMAALGMACTGVGFIFWDQARRRQPLEQ